MLWIYTNDLSKRRCMPKLEIYFEYIDEYEFEFECILVYEADQSLTYSLGSQNSIEWRLTPDGNPPYITYTTGQRNSRVDLVCLESGEDQFEANGENPTSHLYMMTLKSVCACWDGCKG